MSWFDGAAGISQQFSSITGQISNFTKEVLTEATQEVEDPVTELQIALKRVNELQTQNAELNAKWEQVKKRKEEETERADTAEFQVGTISQEYRKLLQQKEDEVKKLRTQNLEMKEQQKHLVVLSATAPQPTPTSTNTSVSATHVHLDSRIGEQGGGGGGGEWMEGWADEDYDLPGPHSQSEISQLQSDLARLQVECQQWRELAQQRSQSPFVLVPGEEQGQDKTDTSLRNQIKELQQFLQQESEQHQHELTSLQAVHSQQLHTLTSQYNQEIESLRGQLGQQPDTSDNEDDRQQQQQQGRGAKGGEEEEEVRKDLVLAQQRLQQLQDNDKEVQAQMSALVEQNHTLEQRNRSLMDSLQQSQLLVAELRQVIAKTKEHLKDDKEAQLQHLELERKSLSSALQELQSSITGHQNTISKLTAEQERYKETARLLEAQVESLTQGLTEKQKEIESLRACLTPHSSPDHHTGNSDDTKHEPTSTTDMHEPLQSTTSREIIASDSTTNVELLQSELEKERAQRQRLQTHLAQIMAESDQELSVLLTQKEQLETKLGSVQEELNTSTLSSSQITTENESLRATRDELENKLKQLQVAMTKSQTDHDGDLEKVAKLTEENETLSKDLFQLKAVLQQREEQLGTLQNAVEMERNATATATEQHQKLLETKMKEKEEEEEMLQASVRDSQAQLSTQQERIEQLSTSHQSLQKELTALQAKLAELMKEKAQLQSELMEIKIKHDNEKKQLSDQLSKMEVQAAAAASDEHSSLLEQLQKKEEALHSLTDERELMSAELHRTQLALVAIKQEVVAKEEAKESKQERELQRLRQHLLQVEEQHTHEAVEADTREKQMRQQIQQLEEKLAQASIMGAEQSLHVQQKVAMLENQVLALTTERDETFHELTRVQDESEQNATALATLQAVLDQFQKDQSVEANLALQRTEGELSKVLAECQRLKELQESTQAQLYETSLIAEQASTYQVEIEAKEKTIHNLSEEVKRYQATLSRNKLKIEELSGEGSQVDRYLIKNMILSYFIAPDKKKPDIIQLVGKILHFTDQELDQAMSTHRGWMASLWRRADTPTASAKPTLASLFVQFLETESAPATPLSSSPAPAQETTPTVEQQSPLEQPKPKPVS